MDPCPTDAQLSDLPHAGSRPIMMWGPVSADAHLVDFFGPLLFAKGLSQFGLGLADRVEATRLGLQDLDECAHRYCSPIWKWS